MHNPQLALSYCAHYLLPRILHHPLTPARRKRNFDAQDGICGYCEKPIDGSFEVDHPLPLALGGADDDGGNTVPMHVECHRLKTFGRRRRREGGDANRMAKIRRIRMSRGDGSPKLRRSLTHPRLVRSSDGSVYLRNGSERRCDRRKDSGWWSE